MQVFNYHSLKKILFTLTITTSFIIKVYGQETKNQNIVIDPLKDDIFKVLPPLEVIIDSALLNNANIKFWQADIAKNESKILTKKRYWLKHIRVGGSVSYGTYDNYSLDQTATLPSYMYSKQNQSRYSSNLLLSIPLYDLTDRRNELNFAELEKKQAVYKLESTAEEIREKVVSIYYNVLNYYDKLKIYSENLETSELNMRVAEKEFLNGQISISEYSRLTSIHANNKILYQGAKSEFITNFMLLQEVAGFKF